MYDRLWRDMEKAMVEQREVICNCRRQDGRVVYHIEFSDKDEANRFEEKLNQLRRVFRTSKGVDIRVADAEP